jgi:murein DD-endopeptidase MepM/ murein hydrolase activator NlpD
VRLPLLLILLPATLGVEPKAQQSPLPTLPVITKAPKAPEPASLAKLKEDFRIKRLTLRWMPVAWPIHGVSTSNYGYRVDPINKTPTIHPGCDIGAPLGTPVYASGMAKVKSAGWDNGYGWMIVLTHGQGVESIYGHLSKINVVAGQVVARGQQIGLVGSTGRSTGPHLHFGILVNGKNVDPRRWVLDG